MDPRVRAADADRERVVDLLRQQVGTGRLTLDEFSDRAAATYRARTMGELASLTRDLPDDDADRSGATGRLAYVPVLTVAAVVLGLVLLAWVLVALYGFVDPDPMGPMGPMMDHMGGSE